MVGNTSDPGVTHRPELRHLFGDMYDGERDTYEVLGYDRHITAEQYRAKFERQDIARRIIELPAIDTWQDPPEVSGGSGFESDIDTLVDDLELWHYCKRADVVSGIGEYGLLFLGVRDGQDFDIPLEDGALDGPEDISYMTPFAQDQVEDWLLGKEAGLGPSHERYNKPVIYEIDFSDIDGDTTEDDIKEVHWSRIVHIAEDLIESDVKGTPRIKAVYNRLDDLEKVMGASAEMFWAGADRKFQFNIDSDGAADIPDSKLQEMDEEVQRLVHGMEHYIKTFNTDMEVFGGDDPNPEPVKNVLLSSISASTGIPKRMLEGSERGELASTQDRANWFDTIESRQTTFAEPKIIRPVIRRLIDKGAIAPPESDEFDVEWPTRFELTDGEQADVMNTRAQALERAAPGGNTDLLFDSTRQILEFIRDGELPEKEDGEIEDIGDLDQAKMQQQFEEQVRQETDNPEDAESPEGNE